MDWSEWILPESHRSARFCFRESSLEATIIWYADCFWLRAVGESDRSSQLSRGLKTSIPNGFSRYSQRRRSGYNVAGAASNWFEDPNDMSANANNSPRRFKFTLREFVHTSEFDSFRVTEIF